ncbi:hypothetical protein TRIATDRAFT_291272 [Trichoderma atroviride IMI 206040]|uniref:Uncharacterized protein n=1 Tax=Hypocrea atroviridis (strain ATCC 20476 / IMI 206040) TaxID=452589 RepID=G9NR58_HYPAI|nr:uncharacterized protein TRIATDRAFT_291272 [Trichoderma atroviride IMI 206040]EHK47027.1 hypothetical protein TRIATDRAFT_291272 [Trichoderma atroviride IMI 206040]
MEEDNLPQAALAGRDESRVPWELVEDIVSYLDNRSIKSLRLTCRLFASLKLRINRVFLSPYSIDIQTFYDIAASDVYRPDIVEVVFDDAFLGYPLEDDDSYDTLPDSDSMYMSTDPIWLQLERNENVRQSIRRFGNDAGRLPKRLRKIQRAGAKLTVEDVSQFWLKLEKDQMNNISMGADVKAFRYALHHLPALRTVTVTPATHGFIFSPLYQTPLIRSIPMGMNYPLPQPWEKEKAIWRGYNMVTKTLAEENVHHHVSEFSVDAHYLHTGLSCRLFDEESEEYDDFRTILQQPNFKKLHLSLLVAGQENVNIRWPSFRTNLLRNAIAEAMQLEHFSMETDWDMDRIVQPPTLRTFLPIEGWANLKHFRLWNFPLRSADLILTLSRLPGLQSIELGFLDLFEQDNHHDLLNAMRDTLKLHKRPVPPRVRLGIMVPDVTYGRSEYLRGRAIWLDKEVEAFLYRDAENLFEPGRDTLARVMGVVRDAFDPTYEKPYAPPPPGLYHYNHFGPMYD